MPDACGFPLGMFIDAFGISCDFQRGDDVELTVVPIVCQFYFRHRIHVSLP